MAYINEIIRVTYRCNWRCKFCNVMKVNNFGGVDIDNKEVIFKILSLAKKYDKRQLNKLNLSFSGGEPTLDSNLCRYIRLAKEIGVGIIELQTNGTNLFKNRSLTDELIEAGLDNIFLAQHSSDDMINRQMGAYYDIDDFKGWVSYVKQNNLHERIGISLNIVANKMNLPHLSDYLDFLDGIGFFDIMPKIGMNGGSMANELSLGFCQPNGYAQINKDEVLLRYDDLEMEEIRKFILSCKKRGVVLDFHFTAPPLCILDYPEYNLEHVRLKRLEKDKDRGTVNQGNLDSYEALWKEKKKFDECKGCSNHRYCLGFYRGSIEFIGKDVIIQKINNFLNSRYEG